MLFRSQNFTIDSDRIACLVCGFEGEIRHYSKAIKDLNRSGYSVVAYEYDQDVFSKGDPRILPALIDEIADDFTRQSKSYNIALATGVSLGAFIAFNLQRRSREIKQGIYGTAGISVSHALFTAKTFGRFRKKFEANGFTERSLQNLWKDIEILEDFELGDNKSLLIVLGKADRIVRHNSASKILDTWKTKGTKVEYISKRGLGHVLTIRWYRNHLGDLLDTYLVK